MSHHLDADALRERLAGTVWAGIEVRDEVTSTNEELMRDAQPFTALTADFQSAGRGRLDRVWQAPPGSSVALSVSMPLPSDPARWGWVPLLVGVALRRSLRRLTDVELGLKWPNDVLARATLHDEWRKVAGILCNVVGGSEPLVIIGMGINVYQSREELPLPEATSLSLCGAVVSREELIATVLEELSSTTAAWVDGSLDHTYRASCVTIGQQVQISLGDGPVEIGRAIAVDEMGRIVLQEAGGGQVPHAAGDVVHVRPRDTVEFDDEFFKVQQPDPAVFVDHLESELLGSPRTMRRADVAHAVGTDAETTRLIWRALGFASPRDEDLVFTEADANALRQLHQAMAEGALDSTTALGMARAVGRTTDRLAMWALQLITDMVAGENEGFDSRTAFLAAERTVEMMDTFEPLLNYVMRRNMAVAISRLIADAEPESHVGVVRTIGFADLVNFTQLVRELSERELAQLVSRFEATASDIVAAHGGALIKTVGDEVLFSHTTVEGAVAIGFDLLDLAAEDDVIPRMRVGMAKGRVLARLGDVYGTVVNRAARLTAAADPGTLLVDKAVADAISGGNLARAVPHPTVFLTGLGEVIPWVLEREAH